MSIELIQAVKSVLSNLAQEVEREASVVVQFAAGDWHKLKDALSSAEQSMAGSEPIPSSATENPHSEASDTPQGSEPAATDDAPSNAPESYLPPGV